ncbi:hypothetical protein GCM10011608_60410 [Micromonospora sonchi]|uniref:Transcriptional regulator n=1 Tax=Micromonospora sonchi TaxID=1763543 RepID=A0A917U8Z6_9ACTN|nr:hypothetical protein [Micromonospora sonchi]GGM67031.1 hypothetical protein GCM10011608_60410 [Micromonospora sonchi]
MSLALAERQMGMSEQRSELQSVVDFFAIPSIVDVLFAVQDGRFVRRCPALGAQGGAVQAAVTALMELGVITELADPDHDGEPLLTLTGKGIKVCGMVRQVLNFAAPAPASAPLTLS